MLLSCSVKPAMSDESGTILARLSEEINRLTKRVEELEWRNQALESRNQELEAENKHLKELLHQKGASKDAKAPQFKENYSVEKQKGKGKRGRQSTGRRGQDEKLGFVSRNVDIYPVDAAQSDCVEQRQQSAWRFISGRAEYVCYHIYGLPLATELPTISGLRNSRSE